MDAMLVISVGDATYSWNDVMSVMPAKRPEKFREIRERADQWATQWPPAHYSPPGKENSRSFEQQQAKSDLYGNRGQIPESLKHVNLHPLDAGLIGDSPGGDQAPTQSSSSQQQILLPSSDEASRPAAESSKDASRKPLPEAQASRRAKATPSKRARRPPTTPPPDKFILGEDPEGLVEKVMVVCASGKAADEKALAYMKKAVVRFWGCDRPSFLLSSALL
jgi:hypothetical protein